MQISVQIYAGKFTTQPCIYAGVVFRDEYRVLYTDGIR